MSVEQQREDFIQRAIKSGQCCIDKCNTCGNRRHGFYNVMDCSFKCLECAAKDNYPDKPKLDYDDFIRI